MARKRAYDLAYNARRRAELRAAGADICVQCWRATREIGAVCKKCRRSRRRWTRTRYLKSKPNAGRQHCRLCGEQRHNARTCPVRDMRRDIPSIYHYATARADVT